MAKSVQIYLGKAGKIFGPYTQSEIDEMHRSDEISQFTWIWSTKNSDWIPLDAPPPPLDEIHTSHATPSSKRNDGIHKDGLQVICHNFKAVIAGKLDQVTETGCHLVSDESASSPKIPREAQVLLNLLEPKFGKTVNVKAKILEIKRDPSVGWIYQIRWNQTPNFA